MIAYLGGVVMPALVISGPTIDVDQVSVTHLGSTATLYGTPPLRWWERAWRWLRRRLGLPVVEFGEGLVGFGVIELSCHEGPTEGTARAHAKALLESGVVVRFGLLDDLGPGVESRLIEVPCYVNRLTEDGGLFTVYLKLMGAPIIGGR